jgi:Phosphotransferase enzyme family
MRAEPPVLRHADDVTAEWLSLALGTGPIADFRTEAIGTGQMSETHRVSIDYGAGADGGPTSVVLKFASRDATSRATGLGLGIYEREVRFYRELAPRVRGPVAACHAAVMDPTEGWHTIVLEDVAPAEQGDQIAGCDAEHARLAMRELARIHAPIFGDPQLGATPWLNQESPLNQALMSQLLPTFEERYGDRVAAEHQEVCERFFECFDGWLAEREPPLGLVHGDYRLDNMLFGAPGNPRRFVIVDWQTVSWGAAMTDAAYFLGGALSVEDRRTHEEPLLREYHEALLAAGVTGLPWDECWAGYRSQTFLGLLMSVAPAILVQRTARGDEMFMTCLARYAQQVLDLDALNLLPAPGAGRRAPLRPQPDDEGRHPPGPEELWNESWYFDAVSDDGRTGVYARLGLYPRLGVSWITALVCGEDRPTVAVIEFEAPLPAGGELAVEAGDLRLALDVEAPLERFRVGLDAVGETHDDAAALLRGERGAPTPVSLDLGWETLGEPYAYRITTRYEIPCRVAGRVCVGDDAFEVDGVGQRDHSWGPRDWWSAEWVWSAGHLDDGTRFHGVEFRLPDTPPIGVGYLQPPDGGVVELDRVTASEEVAPDGLIATAQLGLGDGVTLAVSPVAFGPLRLVAPDGRVSEFPRALCRVQAEDGRTGVAWFEWNRNRSLADSSTPSAARRGGVPPGRA